MRHGVGTTLAMLLLAGCTVVTRRPVSPEVGSPLAGSASIIPQLSASGHFDSATGALHLETAVVGTERRMVRSEVCEETDYEPWWIGFTATAGASAIASLAVFGTVGNDGLFSRYGAVGFYLTLGSALVGLVGMGLGIADARDEPECRLEEEPVPLGPENERMPDTPVFVRVDRPDGRSLQRLVELGAAVLPLEPELFSCPPDCPATTARVTADSSAALRVEQLQVTAALHDVALYGAYPPNVGFAVDVPLMPEGWSAPPPAPSPVAAPATGM
jgi:hypothetical protein